MASLDLYFLDKKIPKEIASNFFLVMKSDKFFCAVTRPNSAPTGRFIIIFCEHLEQLKSNTRMTTLPCIALQLPGGNQQSVKRVKMTQNFLRVRRKFCEKRINKQEKIKSGITNYNWRWRTASNKQMPVATDTFKLLTVPAMGIFIR